MTESAVASSRDDTPDRGSVAGYLAVVVATACWGTSGIFVKFIVAGSDVTALSLAFWRDLTTSIVLVTGMLLLRRDRLRVQRHDLPSAGHCVWLAALGGSLGIFHVFWNLGVLLNGAAVATVQQAAMPAIVAVVAWLVWRESLGWRKVLAIALTFVGTVLATGLDVLLQANVNLPGLLAGMGIPITYAGWTLFGKRVRADYDPFTTLTYAFCFATLALLPLQAFTPQPGKVPLDTWLWFAGFIGVATFGGFSFYLYSLGRLPASVASILAMSEIPIVAVYTYVLLNERLTADQVLGSVLVVLGVLLLSRPNRH